MLRPHNDRDHGPRAPSMQVANDVARGCLIMLAISIGGAVVLVLIGWLLW